MPIVGLIAGTLYLSVHSFDSQVSVTSTVVLFLFDYFFVSLVANLWVTLFVWHDRGCTGWLATTAGFCWGDGIRLCFLGIVKLGGFGVREWNL